MEANIRKQNAPDFVLFYSKLDVVVVLNTFIVNISDDHLLSKRNLEQITFITKLRIIYNMVESNFLSFCESRLH